MQGCFVESALNCLFAAIALPLGLFLVVYGIILTTQGNGDTGVFLIVLGVLLIAAVLSGFITGKSRAARQKRNNEAKKKKSPKP